VPELDSLTAKAFHRQADGSIVEVTLSRLDFNHAIKLHPHEYSVDGKFAAPDDPLAAQRRLLASPGWDGELARWQERTPSR
jgi:hypothetical protein